MLYRTFFMYLIKILLKFKYLIYSKLNFILIYLIKYGLPFLRFGINVQITKTNNFKT